MKSICNSVSVLKFYIGTMNFVQNTENSNISKLAIVTAGIVYKRLLLCHWEGQGIHGSCTNYLLCELNFARNFDTYITAHE